MHPGSLHADDWKQFVHIWKVIGRQVPRWAISIDAGWTQFVRVWYWPAYHHRRVVESARIAAGGAPQPINKSYW